MFLLCKASIFDGPRWGLRNVVQVWIKYQFLPITCYWTFQWRCTLLHQEIISGKGNQDEVLLMEKILHHLGCIKPCQEWEKQPTSTCDRRIAEPSTICSHFKTELRRCTHSLKDPNQNFIFFRKHQKQQRFKWAVPKSLLICCILWIVLPSYIMLYRD